MLLERKKERQGKKTEEPERDEVYFSKLPSFLLRRQHILVSGE
jgi:hypothetical protein